MSKTTVAFQGEHGAYSEAAAYEYFGETIQPVPCKSFDDIFQKATDGEVDYGLVPIENSLAGSIHRNYDLLMRYQLKIIGEYHLRVSHCLMAIKETKLENIKQVYSHPQALAQCEGSLTELGLERIATYDTAGSANQISQSQDAHSAAIASKHAASVYGLKILKEGLEDNPANFTRFLHLTRQSETKLEKDKNGDYKTSIVFSLQNLPGALFKALSVFALRDIDLHKIESRPISGKPWEYLFYIDFAGHIESQTSQRAINNLDEIASMIRVLGSYKRHQWNVQ